VPGTIAKPSTISVPAPKLESPHQTLASGLERPQLNKSMNSDPNLIRIDQSKRIL